MAARSRAWLTFWNDAVGLPGFYPFDLLAAAYVLNPAPFNCAVADAWVAPTPDMFGWLYSPVSVLVGLPGERPPGVRAATRTEYCPAVDPGLHEGLLQHLTARPSTPADAHAQSSAPGGASPRS